MTLDIRSDNNAPPADAKSAIVSTGAVLFHRIEDTAGKSTSAKRRKLLRKVFGKTNKSPFCWGLAAGTEKNSPQKLIQRSHRQFWDSDSVSQATTKQLKESCEKLHSKPEILGAIALVAYCSELTVQVPDSMKPENPSLNCQLQQVELQLWNGLNSASDFDCNEAVELMEGLTERMLDGDGWPGAEFFPEFGLLAASWIRCAKVFDCLLYTSPSPRDATLSRMPSSA